MILIFASPVSGAGAQFTVNIYGPFELKLRAFDIGNNLLYDSGLLAGITSPGGDNSALFVGALSTSANIASIEISSPTPTSFGDMNDFAMNQLDIVSGRVAAVPEPSTLTIFSIGLFSLFGVALRRRVRKRDLAI